MKMPLVMLLLLPALTCCDAQPPALTYGGAQLWLKKAEPNELGITSIVSNCPVTRDEVDKEVRGVMDRARLKPLIFRPDKHELGMQVNVTCYSEISDQVYSFTVTVDFLGVKRFGDNATVFRYGNGGYSWMGAKDAQGIRRIVKGVVEYPVTEYLEANDLGDDE
jgi:hypothetical protein